MKLPKGKGGFTLAELSISVGLMAAIAGSVLMVTSSTNDAIDTGMTGSELDALGRRAMDRIAGLLVASRRGSVLPAAPAAETPGSTTLVDFTRVNGFDGVNATWSNLNRIEFVYEDGELDDGLDNNGNGLADEGRVNWTRELGTGDQHTVTLCKWVAEVADGEVLDGFADENGNGLVDERGLAFSFDGERVTVLLTLSQVDADGRVHTRSFERTIAFRQS